MPLDHYVSQVHLRKFVAGNGKGMLHAYRKTDLKQFDAWPKNVCRTKDGNTNAYLNDPRAVELLLKEIEPQYDPSLEKVRADKIDTVCVFSLAGFASYVDCCSPGGVRIYAQPLQEILHATARILDRQGRIERAPAELGNRSITELLADGTVKIDIDGKYPQMIGISTILDRISILGNSTWEVLENPGPGIPFVTSDFPFAIGYPSGTAVFSRVVPFAPDLAVRIVPDPQHARAEPDLSFSRFLVRRRTLSKDQVMELNRQIVRCAESLVFTSDASEWLEKLVLVSAAWRVEMITNSIPHRDGLVTSATMKVAEHRRG